MAVGCAVLFGECNCRLLDRTPCNGGLQVASDNKELQGQSKI